MLKTLSTAGLLIVCVLSLAAASKPEPGGERKKDPAMEAVKDDPSLPRVLLIGDSISIGYTLPTRELLKSKANVHRIPTNGGPTSRGVEQLDKWLGNGKWDVIHFNFGLHDLKMIDGKHQVPIDQYEANLRTIVQRLQKTGAKLIWCTTTPIPPAKMDPPRDAEDVVRYNAAAAKVMTEAKLRVNDLYSFALPKLKEIQREANVHFTPAGSKVLAGQVAKAIAEALAKE